MENNDIGLSHIAFAVKNLDASIAFYQQFANMKVIHRRGERGTGARPVAWLSDMTRHFAIVLAEDPESRDGRQTGRSPHRRRSASGTHRLRRTRRLLGFSR